MHFRFYRGTRAGFLNLSRVDIWTRQVFVGEGPVHHRACHSIPDLYPLGAAATSSLSRDKKTVSRHCWRDILTGSQFLVENH